MTREAIDVLLVEDDSLYAASVACLLRARGHGRAFEVHRAVALQQALDAFGKRDIDVVLLDLSLPDSDGVATVRRMREAKPEMPIVVLTGADDEETALAALKLGAQDYLVKSEIEHPSLLVRAIRYAMERQALGDRNDRLAEELRHSEKMVSLGALASGMTLGFNTLLGNILEQAESALDALASPEPRPSIQEPLVAIRREVLRAAAMTDQLRDFCGSRAAVPHPIDLSALVADVSQTLEAVAGNTHRIRYGLQKSGPVVLANRLQLYQVLVALVANSIEAIGDRPGRVCVATGTLQGGRDASRDDVSSDWSGLGESAAAGGTFAWLEVSDTGRGMDAATRRRIFEPFFTTKRVGRGLGLAAVAGIVRQLGAGIEVKSAEGGGTAVRVLFRPFEGGESGAD